MTSLRKRDGEFVETDIDGEKVVMSLTSGEFFALRDTGLQIWALLDRVGERDALLAGLAAEYRTAGNAIANDLDAFLAELQAAGLVGPV